MKVSLPGAPLEGRATCRHNEARRETRVSVNFAGYRVPCVIEAKQVVGRGTRGPV